MRALILADGRTSHDLGNQQPICLLPLAGKPLLDHQIAALRSGGATEIAVVRGFRGEMINRPDLTWFENPRWAETNAVVSLATAAAWLRSGPVIVSDPNVFYRREPVQKLGAARGSLMLAYDRQWRELWQRRFADPLPNAGKFRRSGSGNLLEIGGPPANIDEIQGQYMGLLKFTPNAWQAVETILAELVPPTRDRMDMTDLLQRLLAAKSISIGTVGVDGQWGRIDSANDIPLYESMLAAGQLQLEG